MNTGKNRSTRFRNNRSLNCLNCFIQGTCITGKNHFYTGLLRDLLLLYIYKKIVVIVVMHVDNVENVFQALTVAVFAL